MAQDRKPVGTNGTDEIKHEIERTRVEMSETLGEIQDRLRPDHLLQQARDGVTHAAKGKVRNIMSSAGDTAGKVAARARGAGNYLADYAIEHPIRMAVAVGAVTWWMLRGRSTPLVNWDGTADTSWDDAEAAAYSDNRSLRDRAGEYVAGARETVGEYASSARESARAASLRARDAASSAATTADEWVRNNPMAAGAIALAVGAAIGASVPRTEIEDYTIGETRDRALERGKQMAQNLKANVTEKVQTAAEDLVGESLKTAATTAPGEGRA